MKQAALINQLDFNLKFAKALVQDVEEELMTHNPGLGLENHPGFTLGHLVTGAALVVKSLGGEYDIPDGWDELFRRKGPGDPTLPNADQSVYPSKKQLLEELDRQHQAIKMRIKNMTEEAFNSPKSWRFAGYFPTTTDYLYFMCVNHEAMHLSQLSAWRRAMNLPSALGTL